MSSKKMYRLAAATLGHKMGQFIWCHPNGATFNKEETVFFRVIYCMKLNFNPV